MEQIAAEADVAKGTLYNHFPTKEALLRVAARAERLRRLGIAREPMSGRHVTAASLERAINAAATAQVRARAAATGEKMRAEDGLASAVATIESLAQNEYLTPTLGYTNHRSDTA